MIKNGIICVISPHTTCSVFFEEYCHDLMPNGKEFLQQDLDNVLEKIIPDQTKWGQYFYPGTLHFEDVESWPDYSKWLPSGTREELFNCDAHLKATILGNSATFELDEPWQGETGYVYEGTTEATNIGIATLTSDTWGLKFTGVKQPFNPQVDENIKVNFDVLTDSFRSYGNEYKAVIATKGHGTGEEVAQLEAYAQGNETWYRLSAYPPTPYRREAILTNGYDVITVTFKNQVGFAASGVTVTSPWTAVIAIKNGLSYDTLDTAFGV